MESEKNYMQLRGPYDIQCPAHINSELEIIYVKTGSVTVDCESCKFTLNANEALLILPYRIHSFSQTDGASALVYMFSFFMAQEFYEKYNPKKMEKMKFVPNRVVVDYIEYLLPHALKTNDEFSAKSIFLSFVSSYLADNTVIEQAVPNGGMVRDILDYIIANSEDKITLQNISNELRINRNVLSRVLKSQTGIGFNEFISNVRIEKAIGLLLKNNLTVTEIAYESGFGSLRNFNRIFKQIELHTE